MNKLETLKKSIRILTLYREELLERKSNLRDTENIKMINEDLLELTMQLKQMYDAQVYEERKLVVIKGDKE